LSRDRKTISSRIGDAAAAERVIKRMRGVKMHVEDTAHIMLMSDTLCLLVKTLPTFGMQPSAICTVPTFLCTPQYVLTLENILSSTTSLKASYANTSQASYTRVIDSIPLVVVKQEGGFHGS